MATYNEHNSIILRNMSSYVHVLHGVLCILASYVYSMMAELGDHNATHCTASITYP